MDFEINIRFLLSIRNQSMLYLVNKILLSRAVWPDWVILEVLSNNSSYKSTPNILRWRFWLLQQTSLLSKNCCEFFLANFRENIATFNSNIWSHWPRVSYWITLYKLNPGHQNTVLPLNDLLSLLRLMYLRLLNWSKAVLIQLTLFSTETYANSDPVGFLLFSPAYIF